MTTKTERRPQHASLRFHDGCVFDPPEAGEKFYRKVFAFEKRSTAIVDAMNDRLLKLLQGPLSVFLAERESIRRDWQIDTGAHGQALVRLRWELFALRQTLVDAHRANVAAANQAYEAAIEEEMANLTAMGIANAMPAAGFNPTAAQRQLRAKAELHEGVAQLKGDWMAAKTALRVLEGQVENVPTRDSCKLEWPAFAPEVVEVAELCGLEHVTYQSEAQLSDFARKIARDFGLSTAALLPEHVHALESLAAFGKDTYHPLMQASAKELDDVRKLVAELPSTIEVRRFIVDSAGGGNPFENSKF